MRRRAPSSGQTVDPARVREARLAAGLSLADVAGDEVSRTLIHFVEHGRTRPSQKVLELIAQRTGKPLSYFRVPAQETLAGGQATLASQLTRVADQVRRFIRANRLTGIERQAMTLVEVNLHQAAALARTLERDASGRSATRSARR